MSDPAITFSTCWFPFKAKAPETVYRVWMDNLLSSVEMYWLVVYTDATNYDYFVKKYKNPNIRFIVKPVETFFNYQFKDFWMENHERNSWLNTCIGWEVNMLWAEKVHFVEETRLSNYFPKTNYYGWLDIGYFRCRPHVDTPLPHLKTFANPEKINTLDKRFIHYALVNPDIQPLIRLVRAGQPVPHNQVSISGNCFIGSCDKVEEWKNTFTKKQMKYMNEGRVIKDDQIILADCIFSEPSRFVLHMENQAYDPWFMFSRILL